LRHQALWPLSAYHKLHNGLILSHGDVSGSAQLLSPLAPSQPMPVKIIRLRFPASARPGLPKISQLKAYKSYHPDRYSAMFGYVIAPRCRLPPAINTWPICGLAPSCAILTVRDSCLSNQVAKLGKTRFLRVALPMGAAKLVGNSCKILSTPLVPQWNTNSD